MLALYAGPTVCAADFLLRYGFAPPPGERERECFVLDLQLQLGEGAEAVHALCAEHHDGLSRWRPPIAATVGATRIQFELHSVRPPPPCLLGMLWAAQREQPRQLGQPAAQLTLAAVLRASEDPAGTADAAALHLAHRGLEELHRQLVGAAKRCGLLLHDTRADEAALAAAAASDELRALQQASAVLSGARKAWRFNKQWVRDMSARVLQRLCEVESPTAGGSTCAN